MRFFYVFVDGEYVVKLDVRESCWGGRKGGAGDGAGEEKGGAVMMMERWKDML